MQINSSQLPNTNADSSSDLIKVSVCAATYKRPDTLRGLLESLNRLEFSRLPTPWIEVIIVDNDSTGSAKSTVESIKSIFKWPLKYFIEANQGVTYARNRCISEVDINSDFIAMLDDDEVATPQWLEELLLCQQQFNSEIVAGPVLTTFREGQQVPNWMKTGDFHSYPRYETGKAMETAFTGNVMFSTKITKALKEDGQLFDHRFAQNGAEDAYLFSCLKKQGYQIVWADAAVLYEPCSDNRLSLSWILNRGFWSWSVHSFIESELNPSPRIQLIRTIKGLGLIFIGIVSIGPSIVCGKGMIARALLRIYRGMGTLSGLLGRQGSWH